jgi:hypothetical protein
VNPAVLPEKCRVLHDACEMIAGGRWPLRRAEFNPETVKDILPFMFIVRLQPEGVERQVFSLFGTMLCQHFGRDLTRRDPDGCTEFAGLPGGFASLFDPGAPRFVQRLAVPVMGGPLRADMLTVPMTRDGARASDVVGVLDVAESPFLLNARRYLPRSFWCL